jgi:hypothetical protein
MENLNSPPAWDGADAADFRTYLGTPSGTRLFAKVQEVIPALLAKGEINEILIRTGEVRGCAALLNQLFSMAYPPVEPEKKPSEYPALEDDAAWADGQKLA